MSTLDSPAVAALLTQLFAQADRDDPATFERVTRMRRRAQSEEDERRGPSVSPMVRAAIENLREIAAKRLEDDADAEAKVVEILVAAASQLRRT